MKLLICTEKEKSMNNRKMNICLRLTYIIGFVLYIISMRGLKEVGDSAWCYGFAACVGCCLFTLATCYLSFIKKNMKL